MPARRDGFGAGLGSVATSGRLRCAMPGTVLLSLTTIPIELQESRGLGVPPANPTSVRVLDPPSRRILARVELSGNAGRVVALDSCRRASRPGRN